MAERIVKCPRCHRERTLTPAEEHAEVLICAECGATIPVPAKELGPGVVIGQFRLDRLLGQGAMGEVYIATQLSLERQVAVKIMTPRHVGTQGAVERFIREVRLLARLDHPNIVTAHEAGEDGGHYYLAMALVDGEDLIDRVLREGPLSEQEALAIVLEVARGLAYAWNEFRLLHRDIKPANIMIDRYGKVKLMDLGLAKTVADESELTATGVLMGTPYYMSPEQILETTELDFRSDLYALGATLYELLTGDPPFMGNSTGDILRQQTYEPLPSPLAKAPELSQAVVRLLERMLAKKPEDRHASWEEFIVEVADLLGTHTGIVSRIRPAGGAGQRPPAAAGTTPPAAPTADAQAAGTFGDFVPVAVLRRSAAVTYWRAVRRGENRLTFVIKVVSLRGAGAETGPRAPATVLEAFELQQDMAKAGARFWAPIHALGVVTPGAFAVMDLYPRSVGDLLEVGARLTHADLLQILHSTVAGLEELKEGAERSHGNLKPGNLLLTGTGAPATVQVLLADPLSQPRFSGPAGERDDLRSLGVLIFQLLEGRPGAQPPWPLPTQQTWSKLGMHADYWRTVCSRLLDPTAPATALTLKIARQLVEGGARAGGGIRHR